MGRLFRKLLTMPPADPTLPTAPPLTEGLTSLDRGAIEGLRSVEKQGVVGFLKKQVTKFLAKAPESLTLFQDELAKGDFSAARETIHKLAGYAGMIGARSLRLRGLEIESKLDAGDNSSASALAAELMDIWKVTISDFEELLRRLESPT